MDKKTLYGVTKNGEAKQWSVWTECDTVFVEHGKVGGKMQIKTTKCFAKNVGRANETTPESQAESEAQSKWNKQYDKYYRETLEDAKNILIEGVMLAQDYTKKPHYLAETFYASPKLDGLRVKTLNGDNLVWKSRGNKEYPIPEQIIPELKDIMDTFGIEQLDGEGYVHLLPLQKIQSCIKKYNENTSRVVYCMFDVPMLEGAWEKRWGILQRVDEYIKDKGYKWVKVVPQTLLHKDALDNYLKVQLDKDFEGVMMRNKGSGDYLFQNNRSNDLLKYKIMQDSEAKVISCSEDKNGQGLFTMEWESPATKTVVTFELSMNGSQDDNTYEKLSKRIGEWVCFKYQSYTEDGKPTFARGKYFRECDEQGRPLE